MRRQNRIVTALAASLLGIAALVQANVAQSAIIDYNIAPPSSGSISFAGGSAALIGSNITLDTLIGLNGIPVNGNTLLNCVGCQLNFTTGNYFGSQTNNLTHTTEWLFNGGGNISITGAITDASNTTVVANSTLFSGTFTGAATLQVSTSAFVFSVAQGAYTGQDNAALLSYFGLPANGMTTNGGMSISFTPNGNPGVGAPFSSNFISSGSIVNDVVPLPAATWLFISGLFGLGIWRRQATV
jgi:hypothetical protein